MWDFKIGQAIGMMFRTMPFILMRCGVYFGIALAYLLLTGLGAGIGWGIGAVGSNELQATSTFFGGLIGFAITGTIAFFLRSYILYVVKAGHIAVLVEMIDGNPLPAGRGQMAHGAAVVKERFGEASVLFGLDLLIKGVIRAITALVQAVTRFIPGSEKVMGVFNAFLKISIGLVDEVILAHAIRTRSENPWASAKNALVLYGQNAKGMLKNAAWLTAFSYGFIAVIFLLLLVPALLLAFMFPGGVTALAILLALIFAWAMKAALIEPLMLTCLLQAFFKLTHGQLPNPEWEARLENASGKFREIKNKALSAPAPQPAAAPIAPPPMP